MEWGGTAGEGVDGGAVVGGERAVAVGAEEEVIGEAADGGGVGGAVVADLGAEVLAGEGVGGVDVVVAHQAQLRRVRSAEHNRNPVVAVIAGGGGGGDSVRA